MKIEKIWYVTNNKMHALLDEAQGMIYDGWQPYGEIIASQGMLYLCMVKYSE